MKWINRLAKLFTAIAFIAFMFTEPWTWMFGGLRMTASKETTIHTEPPRPDGLVDYAAIINGKLSAGVTPETNAVTIPINLVPSRKWKPEQPEATCPALTTRDYFQVLQRRCFYR